MSSYDVNEEYISLIKKAGTPPTDAWNAVADVGWLDLFKTFVEGVGKEDLIGYSDVLEQIEIDKKDPITVWKDNDIAWSQDTKLVYEEVEESNNIALLKSEMVNEATSQLEEFYKDEFLPLVKDINAGVFDEAEGEENLVSEIDDLLNQLATVVEQKSDGDVTNLIDKVHPENYGTSATDLDNLLEELVEIHKSSDQKRKQEFRKSVQLDESQIANLIDELMAEGLPEPSSDDLENLIKSLADEVQGKSTDNVIKLIDIEELNATETEIEELFGNLNEYIKATDKKTAINQLRRSTSVSDEDIKKLLDDLANPKEIDEEAQKVSAELDQKIDLLLQELVTNAPDPSNRHDFLDKAVDEKDRQLSTGDDFLEFLDNLVKLSQEEDKNLRRSLRQSVNLIDIDELINAIDSIDLTDNRPPAILASQWSKKNVGAKNYQHMNNNDGKSTMQVIANGEYVLIGNEWDTDSDGYRGALTPAWRGEKGYPGETGLTEIGQATIQKGSGPFNAGKVVVSGITSARNRAGIVDTVKLNSKKKVVFED
ncbi:MAG TPA: hypothetical protein VG435_16760 [Acidimicrobiales bacterium]|jgi:hypothetical protein|nr:hypothetical protein [Acidimicrobiales bacterium]